MNKLCSLPSGESVVLLSPFELTTQKYIRWLGFHISQTVDVRFKLKACSDAYLFLTENVGVAVTGYEISLGFLYFSLFYSSDVW